MAGRAIKHVTLQPQITTIFAAGTKSVFRGFPRIGQSLAIGLPLPLSEAFPCYDGFRWVRPFNGADFEDPAIGILCAAKMGVEGTGLLLLLFHSHSHATSNRC